MAGVNTVLTLIENSRIMVLRDAALFRVGLQEYGGFDVSKYVAIVRA